MADILIISFWLCLYCISIAKRIKAYEGLICHFYVLTVGWRGKKHFYIPCATVRVCACTWQTTGNNSYLTVHVFFSPDGAPLLSRSVNHVHNLDKSRMAPMQQRIRIPLQIVS